MGTWYEIERIAITGETYLRCVKATYAVLFPEIISVKNQGIDM